MTFAHVLLKIIVPLLAACIGAILAFRYQRTIELKREKRYILQAITLIQTLPASNLDTP